MYLTITFLFSEKLYDFIWAVSSFLEPLCSFFLTSVLVVSGLIGSCISVWCISFLLAILVFCGLTIRDFASNCRNWALNRTVCAQPAYAPNFCRQIVPKLKTLHYGNAALSPCSSSSSLLIKWIKRFALSRSLQSAIYYFIQWHK